MAGAADLDTSSITAAPTADQPTGLRVDDHRCPRDTNGNSLDTSAGDRRHLDTRRERSPQSPTTATAPTRHLHRRPASTGSASLLPGHRDDAAGTATVVFLAGGQLPARFAITAEPGAIPADGVSTSTITLSLFDANGIRVHQGRAEPSRWRPTWLAVCGHRQRRRHLHRNPHRDRRARPHRQRRSSSPSTGPPAPTPRRSASCPALPRPTRRRSSPTRSSFRPTGRARRPSPSPCANSSGNVVTDAGDIIILTTDRGSLSDVTDNGDCTYTVSLTSGTTAGTANVVVHRRRCSRDEHEHGHVHAGTARRRNLDVSRRLADRDPRPTAPPPRK